MDKYLIKKSIFQIFNGFRIVAFWIFASLLFLSVIAAVRESKVKVTVELEFRSLIVSLMEER